MPGSIAEKCPEAFRKNAHLIDEVDFDFIGAGDQRLNFKIREGYHNGSCEQRYTAKIFCGMNYGEYFSQEQKTLELLP